jgi:hypothetical protein
MSMDHMIQLDRKARSNCLSNVWHLVRYYGSIAIILQFVKSLTSKRFKLNPYVPSVSNKKVKGEQLTVYFHVDNCQILRLVP